MNTTAKDIFKKTCVGCVDERKGRMMPNCKYCGRLVIGRPDRYRNMNNGENREKSKTAMKNNDPDATAHKVGDRVTIYGSKGTVICRVPPQTLQKTYALPNEFAHIALYDLTLDFANVKRNHASYLVLMDSKLGSNAKRRITRPWNGCVKKLDEVKA